VEYLIVVEHCFPDQPSGSARVAWDMAQLMRDRGAFVSLICYCPRDARNVGLEMVDGINVVRYLKEQKPAWHPGRFTEIVDSTEIACRRWLAGRHFDCVHVHSPLQGLGIIRAVGPGPKYLATVHSPLFLEQEVQWRHQGLLGQVKILAGRRLLLAAESELLNHMSLIHALSQFTRREIQRFHGLGDRVRVIPHWFRPRRAARSKTEARAALGWPGDKPVFFTVRGLRPRYGVDVAIKALGPLLSEFDARFVIAGSGPLRTPLETLARATEGGDRITFIGAVSDEQLELAYTAADLFILPTVELECFGLITLEAFHMGCPVLSTDAGAIPEVMRPILPDMIVPAGDVRALRSRARDFLGQRIALPDGAVLADYAEKNFGKNVIAPQLVALIEELFSAGLSLPARATGV